jgi:hypothetical protein
VAEKDLSLKKYVVRLSAEEREHLQTLIGKGKSPAKRLLKARILLNQTLPIFGLTSLKRPDIRCNCSHAIYQF